MYCFYKNGKTNLDIKIDQFEDIYIYHERISKS